MKKILLALFLSSLIFAHVVTLSVEDVENEKGLIKISASSDNGESEEGSPIFLVSDLAYDGDEEVFEEEGGEDYHGKLILFKGKLNENNELIIPKAAVKRYLIILPGGIDHNFVTKGIALQKDEEENWEKLIERYSDILGEFKDKMKIKKH